VAPKAPCARNVTSAEIATQLRQLGVHTGDVLLVHMSYRAIRPVDGGPQGVIAALREAVGETGTVVMPSWGDDDETPFDATMTPVARDLGVTADFFWREPDVRRSAHSFAFAAAGPHAGAIVADPLPLPPHRTESPVGRVHELNGKVLLLGVGHDSNTTLHLAEVLSRVPYGVPKHCTIARNGQRVRIDYLENDHCCQRFALADEWLRAEGLQREGTVGSAHARLSRSRDIVRVATAQLLLDPLIFLHAADAGCGECDAARKSIKGRT
jgi:aminoglycoside N3'-acetyltransferase